MIPSLLFSSLLFSSLLFSSLLFSSLLFSSLLFSSRRAFRVIFFGAVFWFGSLVGVAGQCPTADVFLQTQAEVDAFPTAFPGCTAPPAEFVVSGADITDLTPLGGIQSLGSYFNIENCPLLTNAGVEPFFDGLTSVGGVYIKDNPLLTQIDLSDVTVSTLSAFVVGGNALHTLAAPPNVTEITSSNFGHLIINCPVLTSFTGLEDLTDVSGVVDIAYAQLTSLSNFSNLESVGGNFFLTDNDNLTNLSGFDNLTTIGGHLSIQENDALLNVDDLLDGLTTASGIYVKNNLLLTTLDFSTMTTPTVLSQFEIQVNPLLQIVHAPPAVTHITGWMIVIANPMMGFDGMLNLAQVDGAFIIENTQLSDIPDFPLLTTVGLYLAINNNPNLESLSSLGGLTSIGGLYITFNPMLPDVADLLDADLTNIGYAFIENNDLITTLDFSSVTTPTILSNFYIYNNPLLTILHAPPAVTEVTDWLFISYNPLTTLDGLSGLTKVGGNFVIGFTQLSTISSFQNMTSVGGYFQIASNPMLNTLTNFTNLETVGGLVYVTDNPNLSTCSIEPICYRVAVNNQAVLPFQIYGNAAGCLPPNITGCQPDWFWLPDLDNDGFAVVNSTPYKYQQNEPLPKNKWANQFYDCDDTNKFMYPGNVNPQGDDANAGINKGIDNDCDGYIDEELKIMRIGAITPATCTTATGAITIRVQRGVPPYTVSWNNGVVQTIATDGGTTTLSGLIAGTYNATVTDNNTSLLAPDNLMMVSPDYNVGATGTVKIAGTIVKPTCANSMNGSVDITPSGVSGMGSYSFSWSSGETVEDIANKGVGAYTVTVSKNGCSAQKTFNLTAPPPLQITLASDDALCLGTASGKIKATVTGGKNPKTYLWSNNETSQEIENLAAATYFVTATDVNGCTISASSTVGEPTAVEIGYSSELLSNGKIKVTLSGSGGTPYTTGLPYRYCRVNALGNCAFSQAFVYSNLSAGSDHEFKIRDKNNCQDAVLVELRPEKVKTRAAKLENETLPKILANEKAVLFPNCPNPFSAETTLGFYLPAEMPAKILVFDATGRLLFQKSEIFPAGENSVLLNAADLGASRVLICRLETSSGVAVRQMLRMD